MESLCSVAECCHAVMCRMQNRPVLFYSNLRAAAVDDDGARVVVSAKLYDFLGSALGFILINTDSTDGRVGIARPV